VVKILARGQTALALPKGPRLDREELPAGGLVRLPGLHVLPQHLADEPGHAGFPLGRLDPRPPADLFVQRDRDVLHATKVVGTKFVSTVACLGQAA